MMNNEQKADLLPSASLVQNGLLAEAVSVKPILFSVEMVRAILEGRKTQTRRQIKKQPAINLGWCGTSKKYWSEHPDDLKTEYLKCPYGGIGDILWVRETWNYKGNTQQIAYKANFDKEILFLCGKWKPSIFMPKSACRIFLKITDIKVERLQDIREEDAIKEGVNPCTDELTMINRCNNYNNPSTAKWPLVHVVGFKKIWQKINGKESWEQNPFVWVVSFEPTDCPPGFC